MSYFADLTRFSYLGDRGPALLNVGWLEAGNPYPQGTVSEADIAALERLASGTWQPIFCRGWHNCSLCGHKPEDEPIVRNIAGESKLLGADNLFIPAGEIMYVAPTLILHYIETHHYLPPAEFLAAARATDPKQPEYERACERLWGPNP
jgi:hypothetical protein